MTMGHGVQWDKTLGKPVRFHPILARFNQLTREVANQTGAKLVDFEVAAQPSYFLDDLIHLTREGNTAMAQFLVKSFSNGDFPFHKRSPS
jgi:poly-D-alanine transfer protein DltD